ACHRNAARAMFKLVTESEDLFRRVSANRLLARVIRPDPRMLATTRDSGLAARIVSELFVDGARISKETAVGRFQDLDEVLIGCLGDVPAAVIHDVAVSSGITSLELLHRLRAGGCSPKIFISDKFSRCIYVQRGFIAGLYDTEGTLLYGRLG